jgi:hypothetical protein
MFEVNAVELRECLIEDLRVDLTPMVTSSPGTGKSDIIRSVADSFRLKVIDMRVSQCEPVDMQGFPEVNANGRMTFRTPEYFPLEHDPVPEGYEGWLLFLDEFNSGSKQTEAAAYKLILDREVYKEKLHPRCRIIAAGNLLTDRAIANAQSTATTSRMTHYRMRIDQKVWIDWANSHKIDHRIISFIKFKPELLHKFRADTNELTFPCPRTWEFASRIITPKTEIEDITKIRLAGTVGEGAAVEMYTYAKIYKSLPTIEEILSNPRSGWTVPKEPSELFAVTTMLAHNIEDSNVDKIITATRRLPLEMQVITFKDIYKRVPHLKKHALVQEWIADNASVMF